MKRAKYVLLFLIALIFIAIGIKTLIPKVEKSITFDKSISDSIDQHTYGRKDMVRDSITKDSICREESLVQVSINEKANELHLTFADEVTGCAVIPEKIEITKRGAGESNENISKTDITNSSLVIKHVSNGVYDITVYAEGFKPMQTFFDLNNQTENINFSLVPVIRPKELSISYIQSLHQDDAMVIVGTIVDDSTGIPLKNVELYTEDNKAKTNSNESGFFQLIIPLPEEENQVESRGTIYIKLNGYVTEERDHFDLYPNGDFIFKIRMIKGSGINKVKLFKNREVNREIINNLNKGN